MSRQSPSRKYIHQRNYSYSDINSLKLPSPNYRKMFSAAMRRTDLTIKQTTPKDSKLSSPNNSSTDTTFGIYDALGLSDSRDSQDQSPLTRKEVVDKAISRYNLNLGQSTDQELDTHSSPFSTLQLMQNINSDTTRQASPFKDQEYSKHTTTEELYCKTITRLEDEVQHYKTLYEKLSHQYATDKKLWESEIIELKSTPSKKSSQTADTKRQTELRNTLEKLKSQMVSQQDLVRKLCNIIN